ncbi:MAG: hypothetical protein ACI8T1_003353 [Verrucomicrobiales bacterium]|jgi:hypothetical protein
MAKAKPSVGIRFLRIAGILLGLGMLGLVVGKLLEDARGKKAWDNYLAEQQARGAKVLWKDLIPPEIPDEENMAKYPGFDLVRMDELELPNSGFRSFGWRAAQLWDLSVGFEKAERSANDAFPTSLIEFYQEKEELLKIIAEAAKRPRCRFDLEYAKGFEMSVPQLVLRKVALSFTLRGLAHIPDQPDRSAADLLTSLRLTRHLEAAPTLLVAMTQLNMTERNLQLLWEGLQTHAWSEAQLQDIQKELNLWNPAESYRQHLYEDRAAMLSFLEKLANGSTAIPPGSGMPISARYIPSGWIYQNMVTYARMLDDFCFYPDGELATTISYQKSNELSDELSRRQTRYFKTLPHPYDFFAVVGMPIVSRATVSSFHSQASLKLANLAITLEQTYIVTGQYPVSFTTPADVIYKLKEDKTPVLYSIGVNEVDDGGIPMKDREKGDWVWQYTYPEFDLETYSERATP